MTTSPHRTHLHDLAETAQRAAAVLADGIDAAVERVRATVRGGGTLLFCGNGGSAADAQHIATEYMVRYRRNRAPIRAIALTTDTSNLTACGNDFSFDEIFSRQVEGLGRPGDLLMIHTTSGNSPNCLRAAEVARRMGIGTIALTAKDGGRIRDVVDLCLIVPTDRTDRAQEIHLAIEHAICDALDAEA